MATQNAINANKPIQVAAGGTGVSSTTAYAVLCGGTTSTNPLQSIASVGSADQVLTSNGAAALPTFQNKFSGTAATSSQVIYTAAGSLAAYNTQSYTEMFDDFMYDETTSARTQPWTATLSGTGTNAACNTPGVQNHPGIVVLESGTTSSSSSSLLKAGPIFGSDLSRFEALVYIPTLSTSTQEYVSYTGYHNALPGVTATPTEGILIEYNRANSTSWRGMCVSASTISRTTTASVVSAATWYHIAFTVNAAGNSVQFFINGSSIGTLTTNIPTTGAGYVNLMLKKTVGTTERTVRYDFVRSYTEFGAARY